MCVGWSRPSERREGSVSRVSRMGCDGNCASGSGEMSEPGSGHFEISADVSRPLIRYRMKGFWDDDVYARYSEAMLLEMRRFSLRGEPFDLLGDLTEFPP